MKILSSAGIVASLFLIYVGYGVQELKASPYSYADTCMCKIGADAQTIPIIIYCISAFFLVLSIMGLKTSLKK